MGVVVCYTGTMIMRNKIKIVFIAVPLLIGFVVVGIFLYDSRSSESVDLSEGSAVVQEQADTETEEVRVAGGSFDDARKHRVPPPEGYRVSDSVVRKDEFREPNLYYAQHSSLFKLGAGLAHDTRLYSNEDAYVYKSNKENIMFVELKGDDTIYTLDLTEANPTLKPLITLPDPNRPDGLTTFGEERSADGHYLTTSRVWFVDGGSALAYSTAKCGEPGPSCGEPVVHIVSIPDGKQIERYVIDEKAHLYNSPHIRVVSDDGKRLYVGHSYEFGVIDYFNVIDREKGEVSVLKGVLGSRESIEDSYVYDFSPDGRKLATGDLSMEIASEDLDYGARYGSAIGSCLDSSIEGVLDKYADLAGEIIVRDIPTGETSVVYSNYAADRNYCKGQYNKIISLKWLDNSRIVFITRYGIYAINIDTKERQTLYDFDRVSVPYSTARLNLLSLQMPYVLFGDDVLNTENGKWIIGESVTDSRFAKRFFVFE